MATKRWRLFDRLPAQVDGASLAVFRMLFGLLMAFAMIRFLNNGWVEELYLKPTFFFPFVSWARPLPGFWMHALFVALAVLGLCVAVGFCYRVCMTLFFLGFTYVELIDQTTYLNHYYLISLLSGLMIFLPAHRLWSMDAWLRPGLRSDFVGAWVLQILRFQFAVVYVFAGLAKLNYDWLLEAQPLRIWLAARNDLPLIGPLLDETWVAFLASWLGAAYDLSIVFLLCYRRTRPFAFASVIVFHVATWMLFRIGVFPWIMIVGALLFFPPDWPRRWFRRERMPMPQIQPTPLQPLFLTGWILYAALQIFIPLRHYVQAETSGWTFHGFNWSWRVMLVEKSGYAEFRALDATTGENWRIKSTDYLTPRQAQFMAQDPAMIRTLALHIAEDLRARGHENVQVFADAYASLNGRPTQRLVDPTVNLAAPFPSNWIVALATK